MKKIFSVRGVTISCALLLLPVAALAETQLTTGFQTLGDLVDTFTSTVVQALGSLFLATAVVAFFYGMVQYIWGRQQGNGEKTKVGNMFMVWGLLALFVMFSVWGIIFYVQKIFGIEGENNVIIPRIMVGGTRTVGNSGANNTANVALPSGATVNVNSNNFGSYLQGLTGGAGSGGGVDPTIPTCDAGWRYDPESKGCVPTSASAGAVSCVEGGACVTTDGLAGTCISQVCYSNN